MGVTSRIDMFLCEKMWFPVGSLIHKTTGASTFKIGMVLFSVRF